MHGQAKGTLRFYLVALLRPLTLRNRMRQFHRWLLHYNVAYMLQVQWMELDSALRKSNTIKDIMTHHGTLLYSCAFQKLQYPNDNTPCLSICAIRALFSSSTHPALNLSTSHSLACLRRLTTITKTTKTLLLLMVLVAQM